MIQTLIFVLVAEIWNTAGQIFFKKATHDTACIATTGAFHDFWVSILRQPKIGLGLACMAMGLVVWLAALSNAPLSLVFPLGSLQYILVLLASRIFLSEQIDRMRLWGTLLIAAGIMLTALS